MQENWLFQRCFKNPSYEERKAQLNLAGRRGRKNKKGNTEIHISFQAVLSRILKSGCALEKKGKTRLLSMISTFLEVQVQFQ